MGGSSSRTLQPVLQKSSEGGENDRIDYAAASMQGWRQYMEDARAVVPDLDENTSFFGVYDGHGGAEVALLCAKLFHTELRKHPNYQNNCMSALRSVFYRMDEVLLQSDEWKELIKPRGDWVQFLKTSVCAHYWPSTQAQRTYVAPQETGSTACIVVIRGNQIILGNVGDSRCVLSSNGQAIQLTTDHKPNERDEKQRIQRAGGQVIRDRVPIMRRGRLQGYRLGVYRLNGVLAVSRVIGDFEFKQNENLPPQEQLATCNPELIYMDIDNNMEFLVIASDGIWDCMTTRGVVNFVRKYLRAGLTDLRFICERLVDRALPSGDNATAILVIFKDAARRIPPLTESDGGGPQDEAATGGRRNREEPTIQTVAEGDEEEEDDDPSPPSAKKKEQHNEASGSERQPLLYISSIAEEF